MYGEEAVVLAEKKPPDLICMDIELMGKIDGIETARKIHEHADIPIIYLTAYSDSTRFARAKETVPYNYIVKPFSERELLASVELALSRHAADRHIRETLKRYRAIVDNAAEGILLVSCGTKAICEANPASIRMLGYPEKELIGMMISDIITVHDGHDGPRGGQIFDAEGWSGEVQLRCRDGSLRDMGLTSRLIQHDRAPVYSCVVFHDITERTRAEKAVRQANRKLNLLSGVTRHDINNQLTALQGYLTMLELKQPDPVSREYFLKAGAAAERISSMIRFTDEYESISINAPVWMDCCTLIETAAEQALAGNVRVKNDIPAGTEVFADPLIIKVFYNLVENAVRYGGKITTIRFSVQDSGDGPQILCEDDGVGVPVEAKEKIFDRGFGKNTGIGLFLSREILSITGITIRESGEPGTGARFEIQVPSGSFRA
jgi:PAS domain S-box-containing protein